MTSTPVPVTLAGMEIDRTDEGLLKAFQTVDLDSSGKISGDEMREYIKKIYGKKVHDSSPPARPLAHPVLAGRLPFDRGPLCACSHDRLTTRW